MKMRKARNEGFYISSVIGESWHLPSVTIMFSYRPYLPHFEVTMHTPDRKLAAISVTWGKIEVEVKPCNEEVLSGIFPDLHNPRTRGRHENRK